jgi:uncharacterized protein (TIGR02246 family)
MGGSEQMPIEDKVRELYGRLIDGWNASDAVAMASPLAGDALVIGYDGSEMIGREQVENQLGQIFADHETATYVAKIRSIKPLGVDTTLLHAVVGMVPPGSDKLMSDRNAIQTVVAHRTDAGWSVALFQTTPAQFHGRPELTEALTAELTELLPGSAGH